jgi:hypothetical protein
MFSSPDLDSGSDRLQDQLRRALVVTPDLMSKVVRDACSQIPMPMRASKSARINWLIEAGAWTDAALALVELALPQWRLRRLTCEDGAWLCSLSRQGNVPDWLSDAAEARHQSLPLAILSALIAARQLGEPERRVAGSVPQCRTESSVSSVVMCCDNFA